MSIEAITEKIISDAEEYANALISEAKAEAEKIVADAEDEADTIIERAKSINAKETAAIIHKTYSAAELEGRKMRLAAKQKGFTAAMEEAMDQIAGLEKKAYISFLVGRITETGVREGELVLNAKDRKNIGAKLLAEANVALKGGKLKLSGETIDSKGGFVIKTGDIQIDSTLEIMVTAVKDSIASEVVEILFRK